MKSYSLWSMGVVVALLSSCTFVQQWQAAQEMDALYAQYVESKNTPSPELTQLKQAASQAAHAQILVEWPNDKPDELIELTASELAVLRAILPHLENKPALCREVWEAQRRTLSQGMLPTVSYRMYRTLQFLDAAGQLLGALSLHDGIDAREKAESYTRERGFYRPGYMLPAADLEQFNALPAIRKANAL